MVTQNASLLWHPHSRCVLGSQPAHCVCDESSRALGVGCSCSRCIQIGSDLDLTEA